MLHIVGCAEIGIGLSAVSDPVSLELPDEQQHTAPLLFMVDIPLAGGRTFRRCALALPVEQPFVDRIVVVHGCGRIVLVRLIQRHKEHV